MPTIRTRERAGPDRLLKLSIPVDEANRAYQVTITVEPAEAAPADKKTPEELGWPKGYFESVFGSISDESFVRPSQGFIEEAPSFDDLPP
jgi:hypothetical protein